MKEVSLVAPRGGGWVTERDARLRVLTTLVFALVTVGLRTPAAALAAFTLGMILAAASGLGFHALLRRLAAVEGFMLVLLATLPFSLPGETLFALGPLEASREGLLAALMIALKANAILLTLLALIGSLEPVVFGHTLARLGVPERLAHLLLMTVRQILLLNQELGRLRRAMRARAFVPRSNAHTWRSYGYLVGMLLVRSLERSDRIRAAMRCRGFHGRLYLLDSSRWRSADSLFAVALIPVLTALLVLDGLA